MTIDELVLARISEALLVRTFAVAQRNKRLGTIIQDAVDSNDKAVAIADTEGTKLDEIADRFGLEPNRPMLSHLDRETQAYIAPSIIKLADAFAGALIGAQIKPRDMAKIVAQTERTVANRDSFAAHGNANLAKLFSPA
jgi:hypothetical protein